jgi:hypothetical protein
MTKLAPTVSETSGASMWKLQFLQIMKERTRNKPKSPTTVKCSIHTYKTLKNKPIKRQKHQLHIIIIIIIIIIITIITINQ